MVEAIRVMTTLNDTAASAALAHGVHAATDVTGFGLVGHLANVITASRVGARIDLTRVPFLPGAVELALQGAVPAGTRRNLESTRVAWGDDVSEMERLAPTKLPGIADGEGPAVAKLGWQLRGG